MWWKSEHFPSSFKSNSTPGNHSCVMERTLPPKSGTGRSCISLKPGPCFAAFMPKSDHIHIHMCGCVRDGMIIPSSVRFFFVLSARKEQDFVFMLGFFSEAVRYSWSTAQQRQRSIMAQDGVFDWVERLGFSSFAWNPRGIWKCWGRFFFFLVSSDGTDAEGSFCLIADRDRYMLCVYTGAYMISFKW